MKKAILDLAQVVGLAVMAVVVLTVIVGVSALAYRGATAGEPKVIVVQAPAQTVPPVTQAAAPVPVTRPAAPAPQQQVTLPDRICPVDSSVTIEERREARQIRRLHHLRPIRPWCDED